VQDADASPQSRDKPGIFSLNQTPPKLKEDGGKGKRRAYYDAWQHAGTELAGDIWSIPAGITAREVSPGTRAPCPGATL
jgi:hypothetical protein